VRRIGRAGIAPFGLLALAMILLTGERALGQSPPAAPSVSASEALESHPIGPGASEQPDLKSSSPAVPTAAFDPTRVLLAMVTVIGLILLLRLAARRIFPGAIAHRASSAVKVLGRCPVSPKQNLLVVQFGKRLVLVGDSGSSLNPLCEIGDPDEVTAILAQAREESITASLRFDSLFGRARKGFGAGSAQPDESAPAPDESFDESNEVAAAPADPSLETTRKELSGLSEKVRDLARQIGGA
jgi:flagellar biogenesis protein FliO